MNNHPQNQGNTADCTDDVTYCTHTPNVVLRWIYHGDLKLSESRVLVFITRNTIGYQLENENDNGYHQREEFEQNMRLMAKKLQLDLRSVWTATQSLKTKGLISVRESTAPGARGSARGCYVYSLTAAAKAGGFTKIPNWFIDEWLAVLKNGELKISAYVLQRVLDKRKPDWFTVGMRAMTEDVNMTLSYVSIAVNSLIERKLLNVRRSSKRGIEGRFIYRFTAQKVEHDCSKKQNNAVVKNRTPPPVDRSKKQNTLSESLSERKHSLRNKQTESTEPFVPEERVPEYPTNEPEPASEKPAVAIKGEAVPISIPQKRALTRTDVDLQTIRDALAAHTCTLPAPDRNLARTLLKLFNGSVQDCLEWLEEFDGSNAESWKLYVHVAKTAADERAAREAHAKICCGFRYRKEQHAGVTAVYAVACELKDLCPSFQQLTAEALEASLQAIADQIGGVTGKYFSRRQSAERKPPASEQPRASYAMAGD